MSDAGDKRDDGVAAQPGAPELAADAQTQTPAPKARRVRDDYSFSQLDLAQIEALKKRAAALGVAAKKNALLRAGIAALATLPEAPLRAVVGAEATPKPGRKQQ